MGNYLLKKQEWKNSLIDEIQEPANTCNLLGKSLSSRVGVAVDIWTVTEVCEVCISLGSNYSLDV